jgi:hypothetical protein
MATLVNSSRKYVTQNWTFGCVGSGAMDKCQAVTKFPVALATNIKDVPKDRMIFAQKFTPNAYILEK